LREKFRDRQLEVLHADALRFDVRALFAQRRGNVRQSSLLHFESATDEVRDLSKSHIAVVVYVQKEMARRFSAAPSTSDYSALHPARAYCIHRVKYFAPSRERFSSATRRSIQRSFRISPRSGRNFQHVIRNYSPRWCGADFPRDENNWGNCFAKM